jgi:transmembrane sensor
MTGPLPNDDVIRQASDWFARLSCGHAKDEERQAWAAWHAADPSHRRAWQIVEDVRSQFGRLPGAVASHALDAAGQARRKALRQLLAVVAMGSAGCLAFRRLPLRDWLADYRSGTGERRDLILPDGSSLSLNTASAVDVAFSSTQRLLRLQAGEVLVSTSVDAGAIRRPFLVDTRHGRVEALGTRFTVRVRDGSSEVAVLEKAVRVQSARLSVPPMLVTAGHHVRFTAHEVGVVQDNDASTAAWQYGSIVAVDMPLGRLLAELARYRPGRLGCDPAIAALKVSGAFPVYDTDRALEAVARSFPVRIRRLTRYWVTLEPR